MKTEYNLVFHFVSDLKFRLPRPLAPSCAHRLDPCILVGQRRDIALFVPVEYDMLSGLAGHALLSCGIRRPERSIDNQQINLACIHIDTADLYDHTIRQLITDTCALATQFMTDFIEMVIVAPQIGNMHHPLDKQIIELNKNAKAGNTGNRAGKMFAQLVTDKVTLEPGLDIM